MKILGKRKILRFPEVEVASCLLGPDAYLLDQIRKRGMSLANVVRMWQVIYPDGQEQYDCRVVIVDEQPKETHQRM